MIAPGVAFAFGSGTAGLDGPWQTMFQDNLRKGNRTTRNLVMLLAAVIVTAGAFAFRRMVV